MSVPRSEEQVQFLLRVQRLLDEGVFTASYKFALLLALADLAVERGGDEGAALRLTTKDLATKFISLYWRQVVPYIARGDVTNSGRLWQNSGQQASIIERIAEAHLKHNGSLARCRASLPEWRTLV